MTATKAASIGKRAKPTVKSLHTEIAPNIASGDRPPKNANGESKNARHEFIICQKSRDSTYSISITELEVH